MKEKIQHTFLVALYDIDGEGLVSVREATGPRSEKHFQEEFNEARDEVIEANPEEWEYKDIWDKMMANGWLVPHSGSKLVRVEA